MGTDGARPRAERRGLLVLLLASSSTNGCYQYRPLSVETVPVGTRVTAALTDRGSAELADSVGGAAIRLTGRVQANTDQRLVVALNRVTFRQGRAVTWGGEPVGVPRPYVASLQERRFSWWRTALTTLAFATGAVLVADRLGLNVGFFGTDGPGGGGHGGGTGQ